MKINCFSKTTYEVTSDKGNKFDVQVYKNKFFGVVALILQFGTYSNKLGSIVFLPKSQAKLLKDNPKITKIAIKNLSTGSAQSSDSTTPKLTQGRIVEESPMANFPNPQMLQDLEQHIKNKLPPKNYYVVYSSSSDRPGDTFSGLDTDMLEELSDKYNDFCVLVLTRDFTDNALEKIKGATVPAYILPYKNTGTYSSISYEFSSTCPSDF